METATRLLFLFLCAAGLQHASSATDPLDDAALRSLMDDWKNTPPSWGRSDDPCGTPWEGVSCTNSRVTSLKLSSMGLEGTLSGDIAQLTELQSLTLSYNNKLGGSLTPSIGKLKQLTTLIVVGCSFTGNIPNELGNLARLSYLALNLNKFSGPIPASLGGLSNLYWLDVGDNQLTGTLPVSTNNTPGLDQLVKTKHFHFNDNQLSGSIPEKLFSSDMSLIHLLFDGNKFTGEIPHSLGLVRSLEVLRLDRNSLSGQVPPNINNLSNINALNLANNHLTGTVPDLTGMGSLNYVDLSNNTFDPTETPRWFSRISSLTALVIESAGLYGEVPKVLFSFPQLEQVILDNNAFSGILDMGNSISQQLKIVSFRNNNLSSFIPTPHYKSTLILVGNPACNILELSQTSQCNLQQQPTTAYSTSLSNCGAQLCSPDQDLNPQSCICAYPYKGLIIFRAPTFRDVANRTIFQSLERSLWRNLSLTPGSVSLQNPIFTGANCLEVEVKLFPSTGMYFNRTEIQRIGFVLSNTIYLPPQVFGPYNYFASPYPFRDDNKQPSANLVLIIGISVGCVILIIGLLGVGIYAIRQKKRAQRATELSMPFASWKSSGKESGDAPQLKGARWFSYDELQRSTNKFSETNAIGFGGYGKVYRAMLPNGQLVAIKKAHKESMQGGYEFKTEIELLSRVHHKNLVELIGFCFAQGEQMLVYEFVPNGTLRESLSGKSGIQLDWKRRLRIALGSSRGLAYLHELVNPPIIHRDVKSTNILLDENLTAKVADFGLSKLLSDSDKGHVSTQVKGTMGYLDPEYYMSQQLTEKSDVYSFGVVMLELITARPPIYKRNYIVREFRETMDRDNDEYYGLTKIMDPVIKNTPHLKGFGKFVDLAMQCVEESAADRPTMSEVVKEIEMILHDDGPNTSSTSTSSSATDFGKTKRDAKHPYNNQLPAKDDISLAFEYSGSCSPYSEVEPK